MRKGAFQMSMGFIVAVVFAVILLTLSITWIQDLFEQISVITHTTTDVARETLLEELASSGKKVGIAAPAVTDWNKGETGSYAVGIKNDNVDRDKTYYAHAYLEAVGGGALSGTTSNELMEMNGEIKGTWLQYREAIDIDAGEKDSIDLVIEPAISADQGTYTFTVAICEKKDDRTGFELTNNEQCTASADDLGYEKSPNLYGSATFSLVIKS